MALAALFVLPSCKEGGTAPENISPHADFSARCAALRCDFQDASTDIDGSIASREWDYGDGTHGTDQQPFHVYPAEGAYSVHLTVVTSDGCYEAAGTELQLDGPFAAGTEISAKVVAPLLSNPLQLRVEGAYPEWTFLFEDGADQDFNDLVLTLTALPTGGRGQQTS